MCFEFHRNFLSAKSEAAGIRLNYERRECDSCYVDGKNIYGIFDKTNINDGYRLHNASMALRDEWVSYEHSIG